MQKIKLSKTSSNMEYLANEKYSGSPTPKKDSCDE
jgi:hypothetical protein